MRFAYDSEANALAITLASGLPVARTVEFDSGTLVDVDAHDVIVTIEVINPARQWPLDEIAQTFRIDDDDLRVMRDMFAGARRVYAFTQQTRVEGRDLELAGV